MILDLLKQKAQLYGAKLQLLHMKGRNLKIVKYGDKELYVLTMPVEGVDKCWILSTEGIVECDSAEDCAESFFSIANKSASFVRKSVKNAHYNALLKNANRYKTASDDDPWIKDPSQLVSKASQELWAVTSDGKYLARLFDEKEFPLKG